MTKEEARLIIRLQVLQSKIDKLESENSDLRNQIAVLSTVKPNIWRKIINYIKKWTLNIF